jgi:hypothetical protein
MGDVLLHSHHQGVCGPVSTDPIGKGRRTLSRPDLERLNEVIGPLLAKLGYEPCICEESETSPARLVRR